MNKEKSAKRCAHGAVQKCVDQEQNEEFDVGYAYTVVNPAECEEIIEKNTDNDDPSSQCIARTHYNDVREEV